MHREDQAEVLVVGAGPVGMLTALVLAESGIKVKIIDQEPRTATHSYACALHPRTLRLLDRLGLGQAVLELGLRTKTIAFYEGESRRAEVEMSRLPAQFPFVVVLPQTALERLLEERLQKAHGTNVHWNYRLRDLRPAGDSVVAVIDKLGQSAKGYVVPEWDWEVERTLETCAAFVVGADGHHSHVRQSLGIEYERLGEPEFFGVYQFEADSSSGAEVRIVLDGQTSNALWPISERKCRWTFQLAPAEEVYDFPAKERADVLIRQPAVDVVTQQDVRKLVRKRAPWFTGRINELDWLAEVQFGRRLAQRFGQGRCWLAGDAAHQTSPIGMQSMNVGLCEAEDLAVALTKILRGKGSMTLLEAYDRNGRAEWQRLLGREERLSASAEADGWVKERAAKMLPCIPASGDDLTLLLKQLGLGF
jgi:2-polyprenyl-6-methoxyphenol hydroxylase-like FAD-dependent oxidoreductase